MESNAATPDPSISGGSEMSEVILHLVRPSVEKLDEQVKNTRKSQLILANNINKLSIQLKTVAEDQALPYDLDAYVQKIDESRKRVSNLSNRLHNIHDRMTALQRNIARETFKQKQDLDA